MYIRDMSISDQVEGFFLLQDAYAKTTLAGKPFLSMVLSDCTGTMDAQIWDYTGPVTPKDIGAVVKIRGTVSEFKGTLQITVDRLRLADAGDQYSVSDLVPTAPIDVEATWKELQDIIDSIEDQDYRSICQKMMNRYGEKVKSLPAAKGIHHSFLNGLLMHTAYMLQTADFLAGMYGSVIDRSLLIAGTLLHDFAKCEEFTTSSLGLVTDYSMKGQLLGHLVMGAHEVADIAAELRIPEEKSVLLQHLILSHHGEPDFGAAVRPMCAEGELLSYIDMIDSRMEIYRETLEEVPAGEFSKRIFALERRIYHHN
ncbi:3'-5' exoribonuclease YhaM family protein [Papillibacter cinnamivorans]|uniref:3'-5' exoribonuclease n=1 Tax=Papillibacter cinnamivorans DSM 12816 TaxID=1122930 RepID=A0A1W2AMK6_9FIRM|nr:HD domain-containing protein [Papillibacter cinnamivorans]SMC61969.1 3'-5' exoribonuclease [Papillibacter cinnamivorans DSM 12816]